MSGGRTLVFWENMTHEMFRMRIRDRASTKPDEGDWTREWFTYDASTDTIRLAANEPYTIGN